MNLSQITRVGLVPLQNMIARINTVWGKEHNADGTHRMPHWRVLTYGVEFGAANFMSASGWAVAATGVFSYQFWKHGDCLCFDFAVLGTLGGADPLLLITIPDHWRAMIGPHAVVDIVDAGGYTTGMAYIASDDTPVLTIIRTNRANFTAGSVGVNGQILLRTTN